MQGLPRFPACPISLGSGGLIKRDVCADAPSEIRNERVEPGNKRVSRDGFSLLILLQICEITYAPLSWESRKVSPQLAESQWSCFSH